MIRRAAIIAASAIVVLVGSAAAYRATTQANRPDGSVAPMDQLLTQNPGELPNNRRSRPDGMRGLRDLNLSSDQMQKIREIRDRNRQQMQGDRDQLRQVQQELGTLMAGSATDDQIRSKYTQVKELRAKLADAQFNSMLAMRNVLTPEQRQKFAQQMQRRRPNFAPPDGMRSPDSAPNRT